MNFSDFPDFQLLSSSQKIVILLKYFLIIEKLQHFNCKQVSSSLSDLFYAFYFSCSFEHKYQNVIFRKRRILTIRNAHSCKITIVS